jgi:hypothetical protein
MDVRQMNNIEKPIAVLYCAADFRTDRCPAKIQDNDYVTATSACLNCEYSKIRHFKRGMIVAEAGNKGTDEKKEYTSEVKA